MKISWHKFLGIFKHDFWNIFLKNRKSVRIYLALAMDRFSSSGLNQKSFSPEWKEIYLLWIHGQDLIEFMSTTGYFHPYRLCPCCPVTRSLSAPQKPQSPWQPTLLLAPPVSLQRQSTHRGRALLTPTTIQWDPHSQKAHSSPGPWFAKTPWHPSAPVPGFPCLMSHWPQEDGDEDDSCGVPVHWCSSTSTGWSSTLLHPPAHTQQKLGPSARGCECAKALSAATVCKQADSKQT